MKRSVRSRLLNLLFPPKCVLCNKIIDAGREDICHDCSRTLPWAGVTVKQGDFHEGAVSSLRYDDRVRGAMLRYKFNGHYWLGEVFGELMAETVTMQLSGRFDIITWAPVSKKRLRQRTYDQSELLAKRIGVLLGFPVVQCLRKTKHTEANSSLNDDKARQDNVSGVYEALPEVEGKRILLIDDVYTTGSTLSECAKTLMQAGAESVVCATFARAGE